MGISLAKYLGTTLLTLSVFLNPACAGGQAEPLRIATTPVFLDEQAEFLQSWGRYLQQRLKRPVSFVQRASYREITTLLKSGKVDYAWICGYPYVRNRDSFSLTAVPLYHGKPLYQSYLIVPASDTRTRHIGDLRGTLFAYADPDSNSGWLSPQIELLNAGINPNGFFRKTFFTGAHRKVVEAVASGLAQGGAVDGYVWETLRRLHPELTSKTRVAWRSRPFGFPPIVARKDLPTQEQGAMRRVLLGMNQDSEGRALLARLNLTGFGAAEPGLFDSIDAASRRIRPFGS